MWKGMLSFILYFHLLLAICNGELLLYVQSNDDKTACPEASARDNTCRLLVEYVTDQDLLLENSTTFSFLPGEHSLEFPFYISQERNVSSLTITSYDPQQNVSVTCDQQGALHFQSLQTVNISSLEFSSCNITTAFVGKASFDHCIFTGIDTGPAIVYMAVGNTSIKECEFVNNTAEILYIAQCNLTFSENHVAQNFGPWIMFLSGISMATFNSNFFVSNLATERSVMIANSSFLHFTGTNVVIANLGMFGFLSGFNYTTILDGTANFTNNTGMNGAVIVGILLELSLEGYINFENNFGELGGVFCILNSNMYMIGDVAFVDNRARYAGGAICSVSSTVTFLNMGNVTFIRNSADSGGAMFLSSDSSISFAVDYPGSAVFQENTARMRGGAVFIQDTNTLTYCLTSLGQNIAAQVCTFEVVDYNNTGNYRKRLYFVSNYAPEAGSAIYGGAVDRCIFQSTTDAIRFTAVELFDNIVDITTDTSNTASSTVSSPPFIVCTCDGNEPNCSSASVSRTVFPGGSLQLTVIALGQRNGTVPATIITYAQNLTVDPLERARRIPNQCTNLTYTVYAEPGHASLELYTEGSCLMQGIGVEVEIDVLSCPPGLVMSSTMGNRSVCVCDPRLEDYTDTCSAQNGTILRDDNFWVGYDQEMDGIILSSDCPFDYCISETISLRVQNSDAQCNHDRSGLLCGECSEGLSLLLGTSTCEKCSDNYLSLLIFFVAAGVILVALLLLLNLTVAIGTINGLIFYANIVAGNETWIFPSNFNAYIDILRVFVGWINLDFSIRTCFYDDMDAYAQAWLQYVFPLYLWSIIGLVFIVSHFSSRASRILGNNPIAVFATLILLSYTKILRTIIEAFSSATLSYPHGESRVVWLYDGTVPFLDTTNGRHLLLFVVSLIVLAAVFIPYTLLLLTSQWLQIKSHWKLLSWLNKPQLRSFLDAYHAPYKPRHRYWTGLLLIIRFILQLSSARNTFTNPNLNFLVIQIFVLFVLTWAWSNGGIYKNWYLNILESFFFLNLGLLAASTAYVTSEGASVRAQAATSSTLVTATGVAFTGIVAFHTYQKLNCARLVERYVHVVRKETVPQESHHLPDKFEAVKTINMAALRESLLDDQ